MASDDNYRESALLKLIAKSVLFALVCGFSSGLRAEDGLIGHLNTIVHKVIERHPSVLSALAEGNSAEANVDAARLKYLPSLSIRTESIAGERASTVQVEQSLWTAGRLTAQLDAAIGTSIAAKEKIEETRYVVAIKVIEAWQSLVAATGRVKVSRDSLSQLEEYGALMQRRVSAEVSSTSDLDLVNSRISQAKSDLGAAEAGRRLALKKLVQLLGDEPSSGWLDALNVLVGRGREEVGGALVGYEGSIEAAVERHPTMRRMEQESIVAENNIKIKRAERFPQVYARLQRIYGGTNIDKSVFAVGVQYVPGAGFSTIAEEKAAVARYESAKQTSEATRRDVLDAVYTDVEQLRDLRNRFAYLRDGESGTKAVLASYERQFVAGRRTWLDVLNAAREFHQYETSLADLVASDIATAYRLKLRLGELDWQRGDAQ